MAVCRELWHQKRVSYQGEKVKRHITMNRMRLEALAWSKVEVSRNFTDLQVAAGIAAFIHLVMMS